MDVAFNFRSSSGYVTDVGVESPVLSEAYPHTYANGATAGFEQICSDPTRDRSNTVDRRVAGNNRSNGADPTGGREFRVDLVSAGSFDTWLAMGDAIFGYASNHVNPYAQIWDTTTNLFTPVAGDTSIGANEFYDATGVKRTSDTDWATNQAAKTLTFSTTIYRLHMAEPPGGAGFANNCLAHLRVATSAGGGGTERHQTRRMIQAGGYF